MSTIKPRAKRACVFNRICFDTKTGSFNYFRNGNATKAPVLFDQRYGHLFGFGVQPVSENFLPLNKQYASYPIPAPALLCGV